MSVGFLLPDQPVLTVDQYLDAGGGRGLQRARRLGPDQTIKEIGLSGLRGRGGAGFPTGQKWASVAGASGTHHFVVANGAEGEPGTFKDRALLRANPYQVVEGLLIAAFAIDAREAYIGLKAGFERERENVLRAVEELQKTGLCDDCTVTLVAGPDEYLFGEEKAMLEVIEGNAPLPRWLPPFQHGLFATAPQAGWEAHEPEPGHRGSHVSNPTLVNNVETLANVPHILANGAEWFRTMGVGPSPGTLVVTVVGDVVRPGVAEIEMGRPLGEVLDEIGGGVADGRQVKAVLSGVSNPVIPADRLATPLTYEDLRAAGSGLGSAGFIVYDDTACVVEVARMLSRFLAVESCGQCPPCKLGSLSITELLTRVEGGVADEHDIEQLGSWLEQVTNANRCFVGAEEQALVSSLMVAFADEFTEHLECATCPRPRTLPLPKIVDLRSDGTVVYDTRHVHKRPDWTYEE